MSPFRGTVTYSTLNSLICSITVEHKTIVGFSCFFESSALDCRLSLPALFSITCSALFCFCWKNFSILKISLKNSSTFASMLSPSRSWKEPSIHLFAKTIGGYQMEVFKLKHSMHQTEIRPVLRVLPLQHESKKLLVQFNSVSDDLNFWVKCLVRFVKSLFLVNDDDLLLSLLEKFLNCFDIRDILPKKVTTRQLFII